jgi:hypothetical protein
MYPRLMQIRVLSEGGLGNQLFQASFAHKLAILFPNYKVRFVNDNSEADRRFSLEGFFDSCSHVTESKSHLVGGRNRNDIHRILTRRIPGFDDKNYLRKVVNEGDSSFSSEKELQNYLRSSSQQLNIIRGYFQKAQYHFPVHDCFASALKKSISKNSSGVLFPDRGGAIVHIRRGDFLKFASHGPLSIEYFIKQLIPLQGHVKYLSVHSDDSSIMSELGSLSFHTTESSMSENPWQLISDAVTSRFFIGSNSSLSWWAAYSLTTFGETRPSRITFPSEWFRGVDSRNLGILPVEWHLVEVDWD